MDKAARARLLGRRPARRQPAAATTMGRVEVPAWRHALINYPHPLLKQGLVVLDTPGLNAIGAEPELTLEPAAHRARHRVHPRRRHRRHQVRPGDLARPPRRRRAGALRRAEQDRRAGRPAGHAEQVRRRRSSASSATPRARSACRSTRVFPLSARQALAARVDGDADALARQPPARARSRARRAADAAAPRRCSSRWCSTARSRSRRQRRAPPRRQPPPARRADARTARPARQERRQAAS